MVDDWLLVRITLSYLLILAASFPTFCNAQEGCPPNTKNFHECNVFREEKLAKVYPRLFVRRGSVLSVRLKNKWLAKFMDIPPGKEGQNPDEIVMYAMVKYFPEVKYALLAAAFWEGGSYFLLNTSNGKATQIEGDAVLSPNKKRIAVWSSDISAGYSSNFLAVYWVEKSVPVSEFKVKPEEWGADEVTWEKNDAVGFTKSYWKDGEILTEKRTLRLEGNATRLGGTWFIK